MLSSKSFVYQLTSHQLIGEATEELSIELGQTLSGLLNASFGNAVRYCVTFYSALPIYLSTAQVEIIVGIAALLQGQLPTA
jgi:Ca2+:H+ antiporter